MRIAARFRPPTCYARKRDTRATGRRSARPRQPESQIGGPDRPPRPVRPSPAAHEKSRPPFPGQHFWIIRFDPTLGEQDAADSKDLRGADEGPRVARIGYPGQQENCLCPLQKVLHWEQPGRGDGHDSRRGLEVRDPAQRLGRNHIDRAIKRLPEARFEGIIGRVAGIDCLDPEAAAKGLGQQGRPLEREAALSATASPGQQVADGIQLRTVGTER